MKHVVFDAGNVLVGLDPEWSRRLDCDPERVGDWLESSVELAALERGELSEERFLGAFCRDFGVGDPTPVQRAFEAWVTGPLPGAVALLDRLTVPAAILSNTNRMHWSVFDPDRALRSRALSLPSHLLGARKPEPGIYAKASAILGTRDVLFLGDRLDNVEAARRAGWTAEQVFGVAQAEDAICRHGRSLLGHSG